MSNTKDFTVKEKIQYVLMINFSKFFGLLGFGFTKYAGKFLGFLMWICLSRRRNLAIRSVKKSFNVSHKKAIKIARKSFEHSARAFLEMNLVKTYANDSSKIVVHIPNRELFEQFIDANPPRPTVGVTGHFGAWELLSVWMGNIFPEPRKRLIVVRQYNNRASHAFIASCRESNGCQMIGHRRVIFNVIRALKEKGVVAFLVDQYTAVHEALRLDFLGRKANVNMGPALLAIRGDAIIFPVFLLRHAEKSNEYTFIVHEPLDTKNLKSTSREDKVKEVTEFYTKAVEDIVTQYPEQWFWMHNRWKKG